MGCAMPQGTTGLNIGRLAALAGGLPVTVSGMTIDRQCSSGMMAIATAAKQILNDGMSIAITIEIDSTPPPKEGQFVNGVTLHSNGGAYPI